MTKRITISTLDAMKASGDKFVMITAYDATFARLASEAGAETILVGDSLGMVLQGHETTIPVSLDAMAYHTECVARARPHSLIVADLPFMSFSNADDTLHASTRLMQAGAQMVKLEGGTWLSDSIHRLVERGVPVCAHLGLTPQSVNVFGGYRVQGRTPKEAKSILADAVEIQDAGASLLVLECILIETRYPRHRYWRRQRYRRTGARAPRYAGHDGDGAQVCAKLHGWRLLNSGCAQGFC